MIFWRVLIDFVYDVIDLDGISKLCTMGAHLIGESAF